MKTKLFPIAIALCFVSASLRADVPAGNFWHNPTFESGTDLNLATGTPDNWNRGGADGTILQVSTANSVSASHSLGIIKPIAGPTANGIPTSPLPASLTPATNSLCTGTRCSASAAVRCA